MTEEKMILIKGTIVSKREGRTKTGLPKYDYAVKTENNNALIMSSFINFEVRVS